MKTLKLFNAVVAKESTENHFVAQEGIVIESSALWAKQEIKKFYRKEKLDGYGLNQSFHKSWRKVKATSEYGLMIEKIKHYISTYGSNFEDEIYIPQEVLKVPELKIVFKVIKGYTREELIHKCLELLQSGIAMKEETLNEVLSVLVDELKYRFSGDEKIKNKEAIIKIADLYGVVPKETMAFFRYIIYRATGESLIIKNKESIEAIKASNFNPGVQFEQFGLEKLAEIFNRFKPLFLAFKPKCARVINRIAKLSKLYHKPLVSNPLNNVTNTELTENDMHWLDNATPFALFKAIAACHTRMYGQSDFVYRIRNGKSFAKKGERNNIVWVNYYFLENYLRTRFDLSNKTFFLPNDVQYALPTSEKMFVGNFPTGTKFYGNALAVGVYWENAWGAQDIDLSGLNIAGKVGWNSNYKQNGSSLMYSGDMTDAPSGAVEYLYANKGLDAPTLVKSNVYYGASNCGYKIIVGKGGHIHYDYMMDPNKRFVEVKTNSIQKQSILGMLLPEKQQQCFVLLNFGAGQARVSGNSEVSKIATKALFAQWSNALMFGNLIEMLGANFSGNRYTADYDLSLEHLTKDSLINVFTENDSKA